MFGQSTNDQWLLLLGKVVSSKQRDRVKQKRALQACNPTEG